MKTIIVTGGLGFIGSNLIELLLKKNFYVINLDKISSSNKADFNYKFEGFKEEEKELSKLKNYFKLNPKTKIKN